MKKTKMFIREIFGSLFSFKKIIDPNQETLTILATHVPKLPEDERVLSEPHFARLTTHRWKLQKLTYSFRGRVLLDTDLGWTLSGRQILYYANVSLSMQTTNFPKTNFLKWLRNRTSATLYPALVWLPYGNTNYWHIINDFIGSVYLLKDKIREHNYPVLLHQSIYEKPYFQELISYSSFLSSLTFITHQTGEWVRCDTLITALTYYGTRESLQDAISLLDKLPVISNKPTDSVFITRNPTTARSASNSDELDNFFRDIGFRVISFDNMSVLEQISVINSARVIIALHGAGMVNLAFHQQPTDVTVVEISASDFASPCFAYLAEEIGMNYHCYGAEPRNSHDNFNYVVPIEPLSHLLRELRLI